MKKTIYIAIFILTFSLIFTGCGHKNNELTENDDEIVIIDNDEDTKEDEEIENKGIPSPLSGILAPEEKVNRRPVAVMFDNHPRARWQAGLSQAEIIYEFMVEAPYTRYMGIYLINDPKSLGPIRSSRPYFVTTLLEYDPVYVRVGGSEQAKKDIINLKIADIDGLSSSKEVFWRYKGTNKKGPHNLYSSMEIIRKTQEERKYKLIGDYKGFSFYSTDTDIEGSVAKNVFIRYNRENTTLYTYDEEKRIYTRKKDGKLHIDEYDNTPITAKNIIIQEANTKIIDKIGRLSIDLIGKGKGMFITNGKVQKITWEKENRSSKTYFLDESGNEIKLNPGITWIQVTNLNPDIRID